MGGVTLTPSSPSPNTPLVGDRRVFSKANSRPLLFCLIGVLGAVLYGYDGTYFAGILAMPRFLSDFGKLQPNGKWDLSSGQRALLASIVQAGEVLGSIAAAPLGDWTGRRGVYLAACFQVALGAAIQLTTTSNTAILTAGRLILGTGIGLLSNSTPLYLSELAPTPIRGTVVSGWQLFLALGQVVGACVAQGTKDLSNSASYRIPIGTNLVFVALITAGILVVPESPRWLLSRDRDAEARRALERINKSQRDPRAVVQAEYEAYVLARDEERALARSASGGWAELVCHPVERRKFLTVLGILVAQQIGGVQLIFSYATVIFRAVHVHNEFLVTIIIDLLEVVGVLVSFPLVARYGRRPLLLLTSLPMLASLLTMGALGTLPDERRTEAQNRLVAACVGVYVLAFNAAWGPLAWVCASELAVGRNRQKIMSVSTACFWIVAFVVTFTLPYLFDKSQLGLGIQIGWIYSIGTLLAMLFVYLCLPETFGLSLEGINELLEAGVPSRRWARGEQRRAVARGVEGGMGVVGVGVGVAAEVDGIGVGEEEEMAEKAEHKSHDEDLKGIAKGGTACLCEDRHQGQNQEQDRDQDRIEVGAGAGTSRTSAARATRAVAGGGGDGGVQLVTTNA